MREEISSSEGEEEGEDEHNRRAIVEIISRRRIRMRRQALQVAALGALR